MVMQWALCRSFQVSHLEELAREGEQNRSSAQTQISCLRDTQEKLKIELDATRARVRETSNLLTDLQVRERQPEVQLRQPLLRFPETAVICR